MNRPRVVIAEDHTLVLEALRKLVEPECEVVSAVTDGRALVTAALALRPEVVVVDVAMPLLNGLDAVRQIKASLPQLRIVVLTASEDLDLVAEAFRAGASGFLLKRSAGSELMLAIREVLQQRSYITPLVHKDVEPADDRLDVAGRHLTPRQREVLQLIAEGCSMKQAAHILHTTPRTVAFHKYRMMERLGVRTTAELIQFAVKQHIV